MSALVNRVKEQLNYFGAPLHRGKRGNNACALSVTRSSAHLGVDGHGNQLIAPQPILVSSVEIFLALFVAFKAKVRFATTRMLDDGCVQRAVAIGSISGIKYQVLGDKPRTLLIQLTEQLLLLNVSRRFA